MAAKIEFQGFARTTELFIVCLFERAGLLCHTGWMGWADMIWIRVANGLIRGYVYEKLCMVQRVYKLNNEFRGFEE